MIDSNIKQLWQGNKCLGKLKFLNLLGSKQLTEISNFSNMPNLEELELGYCTSLNIVDPSIGVLKKLTLLSLSGCKNLTSLPSSIQYLDSLETIYLNNCSNLEKFLEIEESSMKALTHLHFNGSAIKELPSSIEYLSGLQQLHMTECKNLRSLPSSICRLKFLKSLSLFGCSNLDTFPEIMEDKEDLLFDLYLEETAIKELPSSIQNLKGLRRLSLRNCKHLVNLPESIYDLRSLKYLMLHGCSNLERFPKNLKGFCSLAILNLSHCNLMEGSIPTDIWGLYSLENLDLSVNHMVSIPSGISQLCKLRFLYISHCKMLQEIPELPSSLPEIHASYCTKLEMLSSPSSILWSSLLKWFQPTSNEHLNCKKGKMIIISGDGGIPGWVLHQEIGSQVRIEPPLNWYEDNHFLGFAFFSIYHRGSYLDDPDHFYLRLRGDPDEIVDDVSISSWHNCCQINDDGSDQLWVALYPKNAIPNKYNRNQPWHFLAAIDVDSLINYPSTCTHIMRCGVQLIYTHDYLHDNVPMLLDHQRGYDNAGENKADDQEPHPKRLRASSTDLKL
ncbi:hypothetical protein VitviT2T_007090 [Vitis vinifera]|uniref:TMV resistance protein N n=1 Tax=Vitis vinifera TaxID=29760 RepID=A0ABY9BZ19_VITVI|nr:hypothetical protein VitviT2T_007090 [Vitis vinifera]